jgi:poly(hydroxyalkanoate) depolymerase family esterase
MGQALRKAAIGMKWSRRVRGLGRGISLAVQLVKAKLSGPLIQRPPLAEGSYLVDISDFGANPGRLRMRAHVPIAATGRPLVVLLHGCGQDAAAFAIDSGWTELSDRLRIPLVLPEQAAGNNAARCFQWFRPSDTTRDKGEAGSIAAMARAAVRQFESDPRRVFVVGLSAGAAMAAALLAAYPEMFAAGASVAGLPVGAARSGMQAIRRMASAGPDQSPEAWAAQVRAAAPAGFDGPWPRLSVWQGQADMTVAPANGTLLATQWRSLHAVTKLGGEDQIREGVRHQVWGTAGKQPLVELWSLPHFPHAYPVGARLVAPGRFVEQAPVDATAEIARFFGLD